MNKKYTHIVGIDEVGRGPIAGPVSVCAFYIPCQNNTKVLPALDGITDSKKLSEKKREQYFDIIKELSKKGECGYAIAHVSAKSIDAKGIITALTSALQTALQKINLNPQTTFIYLDGGLYAPENYDQETVIKGDSNILHISAASVIAKVLRDKKMINYAEKYPHYGFEQHKGYGTKKHKDAIDTYGVTEIHRKTWIKN